MSKPQWLVDNLAEVIALPAITTDKACRVEVCTNDAVNHGACQGHWMMIRRRWRPENSDISSAEARILGEPPWVSAHADEISQLPATLSRFECMVGVCDNNATNHGLCINHWINARRKFKP